MSRDGLAAEITWGMAAGLLGTAIMDLVILAFFAAAGMPLDLVYSFIGDVAKQGLLRVGVAVPGGVPLGALVHFLLGLALGAVFEVAVSRIRRLRTVSVVKGALLGVLYIEVVSQPILVLAPLVMTMTTSDVLRWYALSTSMHVIYGIVLGVAMAVRRRRIARPD